MAALLEYAMRSPWCLDEGVALRLMEILERHERGEKLPEAEIRMIVEARDARKAAADGEDKTKPGPDPYTVGNVRVIPVEGVMCRYANMINGVSQPEGTHTEAVISNIDAALADPLCTSILMVFDSPGGTTAGMDDLATAIRDANKTKPVVAYASDMMCSAAYWAASQSGQVFASSSSRVGSIGVYSIIRDTSAQYEKQGIKLHLVKAGATKGVGAPGLPVTAADLAVVQEGIDAALKVFVDQALVKGRGMELSAAMKLADGRVHQAQDAASLGLVDGVIGRRELLKRMNAQYGRGGSPSAFLTTAGQSGLESPMKTLAELKIADPDGAAKIEAEALAAASKDNPAKIEAAAKELAAKLAAESATVAATMEQIEAAIPAGTANRDAMILASLKAKHTPAQVMETLNAALITENAALSAKVAELDKTVKGLGPNGTGAPALKFTGSAAEVKDYPGLVRAIMADGKPLGEALLTAQKQAPKLHEAWVAAGCPTIEAA